MLVRRLTDPANSLFNMSSNLFSSYLLGKAAAKLIITKDGSTQEYVPFGDNVKIDLTEKSGVEFIDATMEQSAYTAIETAIENNRYPILLRATRTDTEMLMYCSNSENGYIFANLSKDLEVQYAVVSSTGIEYNSITAKSELVPINWNINNAQGMWDAVQTALENKQLPYIITPGGLGRFGQFAYAASSRVAFTAIEGDGTTGTLYEYRIDNGETKTAAVVTTNFSNGGSGGSFTNIVDYESDDCFAQIEALVQDNVAPILKATDYGVPRYATLQSYARGTYGFVRTDETTIVRYEISESNKQATTTYTTVEQSIIVSPALDVVSGQVSAASSAQTGRPSMLGHAFSIGAEFNFKEGDVFGFCNVNKQPACNVLVFAVYRWDKDANQLNLIALSENAATYVHDADPGYKVVPVHSITDGYYDRVNARAIHYFVTFCDTESLKLAGLEAVGSQFSMSRPFAMFKKQALNNASTPELIRENYAQIDISSFNFEQWQERVCVALYHVI